MASVTKSNIAVEAAGLLTEFDPFTAHSEDETNPEYDRGVVESTGYTLGFTGDDKTAFWHLLQLIRTAGELGAFIEVLQEVHTSRA